jgi:NADPH:quinone reductase-like Zn-dependent oxidoreductase
MNTQTRKTTSIDTQEATLAAFADRQGIQGPEEAARDRADRLWSAAGPGRQTAAAMKAILHYEYGSPDVLRLEEIETPRLADDGVLVRVRAASVNPPDIAGVTGVPYIVRPIFGLRRPRIRVRGTDLAGVVEQVGRDVTGLRVGDEVFGEIEVFGKAHPQAGAFAEIAAARPEQLAPKPVGLTFEEAAAVPMSGLTALRALRDVARVRPGQSVLITGAGGGIGSFAVQIAKAMGAEVTGVCSTDKLDLVRSLGADHVIDYTREDFTERPERYDVVLDNVLRHSLTRLVRVVDRDGTLIPNGGQFWKRWFGGAGVIVVQGPLLSLVVPQRIRGVTLKEKREGLLALSELLESGRVKPVIGRTYSLNETPAALADFAGGHARGKLVIAV